MTELPHGLVAWAGREGPSILLDAVRRRARRGFGTESGVVRVELSAAQRSEVARLLGTRWDVSGGPVRLQYLADALAEHELSVRRFVETLDGEPLVDNRERVAEREAAAATEQAAAIEAVAAAGVDAASARAWLADPGLPRAGTGDLRALAERAATVLGRLPARPPQRLAGVAAAAAGDAHALDYRQDLGRAVSRLLAAAHGLPRPLRAGRDWRRAWAAAGVLCDTVSSRALVLNLPARGDAAAVGWCAAAPGEPLWLSLRSVAGTLTAPAGTPVFVCENPTVVEAAADELGARCPPLVCTDGIPSLAALDLLAALDAAGCAIGARADIDDAGFVVVEQVLAAAPDATPWRFDADTYTRFLGPDAVTEPCRDAVPDAARLRALYERHRVAMHEEALLDTLIADLAAHRR